ncbi:UDP-N-acetylglucosamine 2-epimerase [Dyella sp. Sa]|uniref:UDP-N-acetylglucosamine 2-epimerase n=2 Tax=Dyella lutea TaxID=2950441 RepID=A0ABT1FAB2_9GAMM|nr:UDP-N-acetylglucosamine 2-epimerase [Dyella lutea]
MQDLVEEFGIRSPQVSAVRAIERSTVGSLLRWLPLAYAGVSRCIRGFTRSGRSVSVLVHGDTLSTLVGAFSGRRNGARVVHLESGLTSGKLFDPFPEEILRRVVFHFTDLAMCPNKASVAHMLHHHRAEVVDTVGNTIVDAVAMTGAAAIRPDVAAPYIVVSLHRFQNIYNKRRLRQLVYLIEEAAKVLPVRFVMHPATRARLAAESLDQRLRLAPGVELSPRLGYGAFLRLAAGAACVLTDGGSNQEELAALGVPTIVMRERTERPDGLGTNALMESDVPGGIGAFLAGGHYVKLRRPPAAVAGKGPSQRIVTALVPVG